MATDLHELPTTVERVVSGYTPSYTPVFSRVFDASKTVAHTPVIGQLKLESTDVIGDATTRRITAQDTEFKAGKIGSSSKVFNKYVRAIKFIKSGWQREIDVNKLTAQVLDQNMEAFDVKVMNGDPLKDGTLSNNGLVVSADPNHITNASKELSKAPALDELKAFFDGLVKQSEEAVGKAAAKRIVVFGALEDKLGGFVNGTAVSVMTAIRDAYAAQEKNIDWVFAPAVDNLASGALILAPGLVTFNYTALPRLHKMGYNDEGEYSWFTFIDGSSMVDVEKAGGVIVQPVTFAA